MREFARMNLTDALTIQAFTAVLPKLEMTLPPVLKQSIHEAGQELAHHHAVQAALHIRNLVNHHQCLEEPFSPLYQRFQERSQANALSVHPSQFTASLELLTETMTVPILRAENFAVGAKEILRRSKHHMTELPDVMHLFVTSLQKAVSAFDEQVNSVLQALEQQLLSVEDIAHVQNISVEQANQIVKNLWERGYIDSAKSNVVGRAMAVFTRSPRSIPSVHSAKHFVLTSRGHFHLHPLLSGKREDALEW